MDTHDIGWYIYARKSSESEDRQVASISDQVRFWEEIREREQLRIIEIVTESKSAKQPGRPEFARLMAQIEQAPGSGILTTQLHRLSRNPADSGVIGWQLQQGHIQAIRTRNHIYKPTDNVHVLNFELGQANQFVLDLRANVYHGMRTKAQDGFVNGGMAPVGYKLIRVEDGRATRLKYDIDPEFAPLVQQIFKLYVDECLSVRQICAHFQEKGITSRRGKTISPKTVYNVLTNETYTGTLVWNRQRGGRKGLQKSASEVVRTPEAHPALIEESLFLRAQARLHSRRSRNMAPRHATSTYLLSGIVYCGLCEAKMFVRFDKYCCSTRHHGGVPACANRLIPVNQLEDGLLGLIKEGLLSDQGITALWRSVQRQTKKRKTDDPDTTALALEEKRSRLTNLYSAIEEGAIDLSDVRQRITELKDQIAQAERAQAPVSPSGPLPTTRAELTHYIKTLEKQLLRAPIDKRRTLVQSVVQRIVIEWPYAKAEVCLLGEVESHALDLREPPPELPAKNKVTTLGLPALRRIATVLRRRALTFPYNAREISYLRKKDLVELVQQHGYK